MAGAVFRRIDPRSPVPLYAQIADRIRIAIATGGVAPGARLPSVRQLASQLRVNPATVVRTYRELEDAAMVESRQGAGTFVRKLARSRRDEERRREARQLVRRLLKEAAALGVTREDLARAMRVEAGPKPA